MARRVALVNNKGGTGKTTTTVRLAEGLARAGKRVLVVDMDPQGNASSMLGWKYKPSEDQPTISQAIKADREGAAKDVLQPIGWTCDYADRITLAPSKLTLENRMSEAGNAGAWCRLELALSGVDDHVDYTLIDCPPSLFHLTQLAFAAAHDAVIVTEADFYAIEAAKRVREFIKDRVPKALANPELRLRGVIVNAFNDTLVQREQRDSARRIFGPLIWEPTVKLRTALAEVDNDGLPITEARGDKATEVRATYELLTQTFLKEIPAP